MTVKKGPKVNMNSTMGKIHTDLGYKRLPIGIYREMIENGRFYNFTHGKNKVKFFPIEKVDRYPVNNYYHEAEGFAVKEVDTPVDFLMKDKLLEYVDPLNHSYCENPKIMVLQQDYYVRFVSLENTNTFELTVHKKGRGVLRASVLYKNEQGNTEYNKEILISEKLKVYTIKDKLTGNFLPWDRGETTALFEGLETILSAYYHVPMKIAENIIKETIDIEDGYYSWVKLPQVNSIFNRMGHIIYDLKFGQNKDIKSKQLAKSFLTNEKTINTIVNSPHVDVSVALGIQPPYQRFFKKLLLKDIDVPSIYQKFIDALADPDTDIPLPYLDKFLYTTEQLMSSEIQDDIHVLTARNWMYVHDESYTPREFKDSQGYVENLPTKLITFMVDWLIVGMKSTNTYYPYVDVHKAFNVDYSHMDNYVRRFIRNVKRTAQDIREGKMVSKERLDNLFVTVEDYYVYTCKVAEAVKILPYIDKVKPFPNNMVEERRNLERDVEIAQNEKLNDSYSVTYSMNNYGNFTTELSNGYHVEVPRDITDLSHEGRILSHCVGDYSERVSQGGDLIAFLRKEKGQPLVTVSVNPPLNKLGMVKGFNNRGPTDEETEALKEWVNICVQKDPTVFLEETYHPFAKVLYVSQDLLSNCNREVVHHTALEKLVKVLKSQLPTQDTLEEFLTFLSKQTASKYLKMKRLVENIWTAYPDYQIKDNFSYYEELINQATLYTVKIDDSPSSYADRIRGSMTERMARNIEHTIFHGDPFTRSAQFVGIDFATAKDRQEKRGVSQEDNPSIPSKKNTLPIGTTSFSKKMEKRNAIFEKIAKKQRMKKEARVYPDRNRVMVPVDMLGVSATGYSTAQSLARETNEPVWVASQQDRRNNNERGIPLLSPETMRGQQPLTAEILEEAARIIASNYGQPAEYFDPNTRTISTHPNRDVRMAAYYQSPPDTGISEAEAHQVAQQYFGNIEVNN